MYVISIYLYIYITVHEYMSMFQFPKQSHHQMVRQKSGNSMVSRYSTSLHVLYHTNKLSVENQTFRMNSPDPI